MRATRILCTLTGLLASAHIAHAQGEPGSLLLFPEFNNGPALTHVFTIVNTHESESATVEIVYIDGEDCSEINRNIELTPLDQYSFLTRAHNPQMEKGYAYAFAKDSAIGDPVAFDYLIGSSFLITPANEYQIDPFVFEAVPGEGSPTELNGDGLRNLDGNEYTQAPDEILVPRFWAQGDVYESTLCLISLTGGARFETTVDFLIYNDNEEGFSSEFTFECWNRTKLRDISEVFSLYFLKFHTNQDEDEIFGMSSRFAETGWMVIDGAIASSLTTSLHDPAILAFLREGSFQLSASLPWSRGVQPNGSLLARSQDGTF